MSGRNTRQIIEITATQIDASREFLSLQEVEPGSANDARLQAAAYIMRSASTMLRALTLPDDEVSAKLDEMHDTGALKWPEETTDE